MFLSCLKGSKWISFWARGKANVLPRAKHHIHLLLVTPFPHHSFYHSECLVNGGHRHPQWPSNLPSFHWFQSLSTAVSPACNPPFHMGGSCLPSRLLNTLLRSSQGSISLVSFINVCSYLFSISICIFISTSPITMATCHLFIPSPPTTHHYLIHALL